MAKRGYRGAVPSRGKALRARPSERPLDLTVICSRRASPFGSLMDLTSSTSTVGTPVSIASRSAVRRRPSPAVAPLSVHDPPRFAVLTVIIWLASFAASAALAYVLRNSQRVPTFILVTTITELVLFGGFWLGVVRTGVLPWKDLRLEMPSLSQAAIGVMTQGIS